MSNNVEEIVIAWLGTVAGEDWPVFGNKPQDPPPSFILIDRTGGPREAMVLDRAEILIECYHKTSRLDASRKANEIADLIPELPGYHEDVTGAEVNSVVKLDDTIAQYNRYQVYCDVNCRR